MASDRETFVSLPTLFPQQESGECRVCGHDVQPPLRKYCSEFCKRIAKGVSNLYEWSWIRKQVLKRDDKTCQKCGLSREKARRAYWQVQERINEKRDHLKEQAQNTDDEDESRRLHDEWREKGRELQDRYGVKDIPNMHVDHIIPVSKGGHPFDPRNLQTLCPWCNTEKGVEETDYRDETGGRRRERKLQREAQKTLFEAVVSTVVQGEDDMRTTHEGRQVPCPYCDPDDDDGPGYQPWVFLGSGECYECGNPFRVEVTWEGSA